jgi:hypothetical protein
VLDGVAAQLRHGHESRLSECGDVVEVVLDDLLSPVRDFLDLKELPDFGHRHDGVVFWTCGSTSDPHRLEDMPGFHIVRWEQPDHSALSYVPINKNAKSDCKHRVDRQLKLGAVDLDRLG